MRANSRSLSRVPIVNAILYLVQKASIFSLHLLIKKKALTIFSFSREAWFSYSKESKTAKRISLLKLKTPEVQRLLKL